MGGQYSETRQERCNELQPVVIGKRHTERIERRWWIGLRSCQSVNLRKVIGSVCIEEDRRKRSGSHPETRKKQRKYKGKAKGSSDQDRAPVLAARFSRPASCNVLLQIAVNDVY